MCLVIMGDVEIECGLLRTHRGRFLRRITFGEGRNNLELGLRGSFR